jgi:signal peptidase II
MASRNLSRALAVAALVIAIDRASKVWIVEGLDLRERLVIPVLDPWLNLTMAWNRGVNFGLFDFGAAGRWVLVGFALVIVAALALWVARMRGWPSALGAGMVIGGALGNVWDRVQYGAVADFLNMSCCGIHNPFAFNVADAAIFGGVFVLILFVRDPVRTRPAATGRDGSDGVR